MLSAGETLSGFCFKGFGRTLEPSSELNRLKKAWLRVTPGCIIFESPLY